MLPPAKQTPPDIATEAFTAPLGEAQGGLWFALQLDPANPSFNTGHVALINGDLQPDAFARAVQQTLAEADVLAVRFLDDAQHGPQQRFDPLWRPTLEVVDLCGDAHAQDTARAIIARDQNTPLDVRHDALGRYVLFRLAADRHLFYQRVHHLLADAWGLLLIENRIAALYAQLTGQRSHNATQGGAPFARYRDVLEDDLAWQHCEKRQQAAVWWQNALQNAPAAQSLAEGVATSAHTWIRHEAQLPQHITEQLRARAEATGMAWPDLLTVLTSAWINRHTGAATCVPGIPFMGRSGNISARVPAMVMNVLPVPLTVDEDTPLDDQLPAIQRLLRQARRHGRYRSEQLRRDLGLLGSQRRLHGPLINVLPFDAPMALPGLHTTREVLCTGPVDDLTITFRANAHTGALLLTLDASPALYSQQTLAAFGQRLHHFLEIALQTATLAEVPTLTPAEHQHWVYDVNATAHPVPRVTLGALLEQGFARFSNTTALQDDTHRLRYAQVEAATAALAQRMQAAGVRRGDIVAVMMPRSLELVFALVATLRCGAAWLPLDGAWPAQRLATIVASAQPRLALLAPQHIAPGAPWSPLPHALPTLDVNACDLLAAPRCAGWQPVAAAPDDAAYVIYTSGSTGTPKGVVICHDAIVNRLEWMRQFYGIGPGERILQKTPATFDVSVWEFFLPLLGGATLVVAPPDAHRDPAWLLRIIREQAITTLHFVPSMLAAFLAEPALQTTAPQLPLRRVFCSGEALPAALRDQFHATLRAELHNLYGPTEAAVDVSFWPASADDASVPVPIGFPVWNTALYILDERLRPVPPGVSGHLFLAGRQLARGYLGRDDLTAASFVPNPFANGGTAHSPRMYRSGDMARWREDGAVIYLGRSDHQVKIRGLRVELDEIENVIARAPGVGKLAVIAREDTPGHQHIVAYIVAQPDSADTRALQLQQHAAALLPDYMLPAAWIFLPALPVTANGKLDRKALPAPQFHASHDSRPPATAHEKMVADLYAQALQCPQPIGADDNFFDLGGHSLLATRLLALLRQRTPHPIGLGALFEHPTVARLAAWLDGLDAAATPQAADAGLGPVLALQPPNATTRHLPALFCIHPAGGLCWCYGALSRALRPARPVYGIQARALGATAATPATLHDMARDYVDTLQRLQPQGPYHIAGWSVGGIIAQAMMVELHARRQRTGVLALLDAYPADIWRNRPEPEASAALKALLLIAGYDPGDLHGIALEQHAVIDFLRQGHHPLGELDDNALQGVIRAVQTTNRLVRRHHHTPYDGPVIFFQAALDHQDSGLHPGMWSRYLSNLQVCPIATLHAHLTGDEAITTIAPALDQAMRGIPSGTICG